MTRVRTTVALSYIIAGLLRSLARYTPEALVLVGESQQEPNNQNITCLKGEGRERKRFLMTIYEMENTRVDLTVEKAMKAGKRLCSL